MYSDSVRMLFYILDFTLIHISIYTYSQVIEAADVVIQVLDARDPMGSRSKQVIMTHTHTYIYISSSLIQIYMSIK